MAPAGPSRLDLIHVRAEIEDLRMRTAAAGYGKLAFFLMCARIVAERHIRSAEGGDPEEEVSARWKPIKS